LSHLVGSKGQLAKHMKTHIPPGEEWKEAKEKAWEMAAKEKLIGGNRFHE
jgi:hypothetical protein